MLVMLSKKKEASHIVWFLARSLTLVTRNPTFRTDGRAKRSKGREKFDSTSDFDTGKKMKVVLTTIYGEKYVMKYNTCNITYTVAGKNNSMIEPLP